MQRSYTHLCAKCGHTISWHSVETNQCPIVLVNGDIMFSGDTFTMPYHEETTEQAKPKDAVTEAVEFFNKISENIILDSGCIAVIGSIFVYIFDSKYDLNRHTLEALPAYMGQLPNKQFIAVFN